MWIERLLKRVFLFWIEGKISLLWPWQVFPVKPTLQRHVQVSVSVSAVPAGSQFRPGQTADRSSETWHLLMRNYSEHCNYIFRLYSHINPFGGKRSISIIQICCDTNRCRPSTKMEAKLLHLLTKCITKSSNCYNHIAVNKAIKPFP